MNDGGDEEARVEVAERDIATATARAGEAETRLADAIELVAEMIGYVPEYFRDKWGFTERLAALRAGGGR